MRKNQTVMPIAIMLFSIVIAFGLIGCDIENTECDREKGICNWTFVEPIIDYSLPQFFIEGRWAKDDGSEELSIDILAHYFERFKANCPRCSPILPGLLKPGIRFYPSGKDSGSHVFFSIVYDSYNETSYDGKTLTILARKIGGEYPLEISFSAKVSGNKLSVDGLDGTIGIGDGIGGGFFEANNFNGTYTLISRPPIGRW